MSLAKLDAKYKTIPRHLHFVTDHVSLFAAADHEALADQIEALEKRYRGLHISLMTLELPAHTNLREYIFWLFNRCRFSPIDAKLERNYSVVIIIDITSGTLFATTGFGFEQWISDAEIQAILDVAVPHFQRKRLGDGCKAILSKLGAKIRAICSSRGRQAPRRNLNVDDL